MLTANDGEFESSASIDLVIRTDEPPTVSIESPEDGGYVNDGESVAFEAHVSDDNDAPNSSTSPSRPTSMAPCSPAPQTRAAMSR